MSACSHNDLRFKYNSIIILFKVYRLKFSQDSNQAFYLSINKAARCCVFAAKTIIYDCLI